MDINYSGNGVRTGDQIESVIPAKDDAEVIQLSTDDIVKIPAEWRYPESTPLNGKPQNGQNQPTADYAAEKQAREQEERANIAEQVADELLKARRDQQIEEERNVRNRALIARYKREDEKVQARQGRQRQQKRKARTGLGLSVFTTLGLWSTITNEPPLPQHNDTVNTPAAVLTAPDTIRPTIEVPVVKIEKGPNLDSFELALLAEWENVKKTGLSKVLDEAFFAQFPKRVQYKGKWRDVDFETIFIAPMIQRLKESPYRFKKMANEPLSDADASLRKKYEQSMELTQQGKQFIASLKEQKSANASPLAESLPTVEELSLLEALYDKHSNYLQAGIEWVDKKSEHVKKQGNIPKPATLYSSESQPVDNGRINTGKSGTDRGRP